MLAVRGALTAFLFFLGLSVVAGYVITRFIIPSSGNEH
jgi:phage shock protein PspC (stress-responsive transcriptional regulator)